MKFRSLLLCACMLVVPCLALCTHLIPREWRQAMRRPFTPPPGVPRAVAAQEASPPAGGPAAPTPPLENVPAASAAPQPPPASATRPPVAAVPPAAPATAPAKPAPAASSATATAADRPPVAATAATSSADAPTALVSQMADRTRQVRDQQAREQQSFAAQLEALGVVGFECQPIPGSPGQHGSSCRMPIDAGGQLQRVFHATGHDPTSAAAALLEQVTAWRRRNAPPSPAAADREDESREHAAAGFGAGTRFR